MLKISHERFEQLAGEALDELPEQFAELLDNVFVEVEETPTVDDLASVEMQPHEADELLGLYQGTPLGERGWEYTELPDRVVIYRRSILMICETEADVRQEVRDTLIHELGHHFGLSDEEMPY